MPVRHVLAEADVAHDDEVADLTLDGADSLLHDAVVGPGAGRDFVFFLRESEKNDGWNSERVRGARLFHRFVNGKIEDTGHRAHFLMHARSGTDEQGINERFRGEASLAHDGTQ